MLSMCKHSLWLLHMWNVQILKEYRKGWTVGKPSCTFTFGEEGELKGKLRQESGIGWQACINMSHEVRHHQAVHQLALENYECILLSLKLPVFVFL